jgi:hypothetical protein
MDTPGLADVQLRKAAGDAIEVALQMDGDYKIIFVIWLQAGRISEQDAATIQTVLDACPRIGNQYAIVINKVSTPLKKTLSQKHNLDEVCACLFGGGVPATVNVFLNPKSDELEDEDDVLHKPSSDLLHFLDFVPTIHISPKEVSGLQHVNYEKKEEDFGKIFRVLQEDKQAMRDQVQKQNEQMQKQMEQIHKHMEQMEASRLEEMEASRLQKRSWKGTLFHFAESAAAPFLGHLVGEGILFAEM